MSGPIGIRARDDEYAAWTRAAEILGIPRNRWARRTLNEEAAVVIATADDKAMRQAQQERVDKLAGKTSYEPDFK